jgi:mitochondrial import inner membrane translocase subunit TIM21
MLLNFYVQADPYSPNQDASYLESASSWVKNTVTSLPELSWKEAKDWMVHHTQETVDSAKDLFRYLSGDPAAPRPADTQVALPGPRKQDLPASDRNSFWSSVTGLFGSLKGGNRKGSQEGTFDAGQGRVWQEGEVHADLVRVSSCKTSQALHS